MLQRVIVNWVYGGFLAGLLLLMLAPVLVQGWPSALVATYLLLPVYMVHQYEEHDDDRFRLFFNQIFGHGEEILTPWDIFITNVPGVWGVIAVSLALSKYCGVGFGLIAVYLMLLNAATHMGVGVAMRRYDPGLGTAVVLFLPASVYALVQIQRAGGGTLSMHLLGLGISVAIHGAILVVARSRAVAGS